MREIIGKTECVAECVNFKGNDGWLDFVESRKEYWGSVNSHTDMSSISLYSPPKCYDLRRILEIAKDRYGDRFSKYLLVEYGIGNFLNKVEVTGIFGNYKLIKSIHDVFGTLPYRTPSFDLKFYKDEDKEKGQIVIHMTHKQIAKIKTIAEDLGFSSTAEITLVCLVHSLGAMLGNHCKDGEFQTYCVDYLKLIDRKLENNFDDLIGHLRLIIRPMLNVVTGDIFRYKALHEYEVGFNKKLTYTDKSLNFLNSHTEGKEKLQEEQKLINLFYKLIEENSELRKIIEETNKLEADEIIEKETRQVKLEV